MHPPIAHEGWFSKEQGFVVFVPSAPALSRWKVFFRPPRCASPTRVSGFIVPSGAAAPAAVHPLLSPIPTTSHTLFKIYS